MSDVSQAESQEFFDAVSELCHETWRSRRVRYFVTSDGFLNATLPEFEAWLTARGMTFDSVLWGPGRAFQFVWVRTELGVDHAELIHGAHFNGKKVKVKIAQVNPFET